MLWTEEAMGMGSGRWMCSAGDLGGRADRCCHGCWGFGEDAGCHVPRLRIIFIASADSALGGGSRRGGGSRAILARRTSRSMTRKWRGGDVVRVAGRSFG